MWVLLGLFFMLDPTSINHIYTTTTRVSKSTIKTKLNGTWLQHYIETLSDHLKLANI